MTRVQQLGLSVDDFKDFLLSTGRITDLDALIREEKIKRLMEDDQVWDEYEVMAENRAAARESGQLINGGKKHASTEERRSDV